MVEVGKLYETNGSGELIVLDYYHSSRVLVRFQETGYECITRADSVRSGQVKDPFKRRYYGVGYVGVGDYVTGRNGKPNNAFYKWKDMLKRCYDESYHMTHPTYKDCSVCEDWHNFQSFADWFYKNIPKDPKNRVLDKDIKISGNRIYSPQACSFVDSTTNSFTIHAIAKKGDWPTGVSFSRSYNKFQAECNNPFTKKGERLGYFDCPNEAHLAWKKRKHELACMLADLQSNELVAAALRVRYL